MSANQLYTENYFEFDVETIPPRSILTRCHCPGIQALCAKGAFGLIESLIKLKKYYLKDFKESINKKNDG